MSNILQLDVSDLVRKAEDVAKTFIADKLKTNQIRNFYSAITRMRVEFEQSKGDYDKVKNQLIMLKPKLAYAAGRQTAVRAHFYEFMTGAIEEVGKAQDKTEALKNFFLLVESVVAYHKYHGGE